MSVVQNKSLKKYNTFGLDVNARYFQEVTSLKELAACTQSDLFQQKSLVLGGGSNVLFQKDFDGLVMRHAIKGVEKISEDDSHVWVKAMGGENWHQFVLYCIDQNWGGLENLSLIPGNVGASPLQNIGAYGVEIKDVFESLEAWNIGKGQMETFDLEACEFGYRESVFKKELKGKYIIFSVTYRLRKQHLINTSYGAISSTLEEMGIENPSIKDVSNAVVAIRSAKLPNPAEIGNAGSFFKNPVVSIKQFQQIQQRFPNMPYYPVSEEEIKIPAGWLIEQAGWKGYRKGDFGVHKNQALVLVNYGQAQGSEIVNLSHEITQDISKKFDVQLATEVNIV